MREKDGNGGRRFVYANKSVSLPRVLRTFNTVYAFLIGPAKVYPF